MLKQFDSYKSYCEKFGLIIHCAQVTQTLSEEELIELIPKYDGWIIGDDPATRNVFIAGKAGKLKAAVKWAYFRPLPGLANEILTGAFLGGGNRSRRSK